MIIIRKVLQIVKIANGELSSFYRLQFVVIGGALLELGALAVIGYWLNGFLLGDENVYNVKMINNSNLGLVALLSLGVIFLSNIINVYILYYSNNYSYVTSQNLAFSLFKSYLNSDYERYLSQSTSQAISVVNNEANRVGSFVLNPFFIFNTKIFISIFILIALLMYDLKVSLTIGLFLVILYSIINYVTKGRLENNGKLITTKNSEKVWLVDQGLNAFLEVNLYGIKGKLFSDFESLGSSLARIWSWNVLLSKFPKFLIEFFLFSAVIILSVVFKSDSFVLSKVAVFGLAAFRLLPYLQQVFSSYSVLRANIDAADVAMKETQRRVAQPHIYSGRFNQLIVRNASFGYAERLVIRNFNRTFSVGSIYGILGQSGAGKSTLLKLLMGILPLHEGEIYCDSELLGKRWLDVSYVGQHNVVMNASIRENLVSGGQDKVDDMEIIELLKDLGLNELIVNNGLDFMISDRGRNLSGGQIQRLAIARSLLKKSSVLILDETTSALDAHSQDLVFSRLVKEKDNRIIIISTHRAETFLYCDELIEL